MYTALFYIHCPAKYGVSQLYFYAQVFFFLSRNHFKILFVSNIIIFKILKEDSLILIDDSLILIDYSLILIDDSLILIDDSLILIDDLQHELGA